MSARQQPARGRCWTRWRSRASYGTAHPGIRLWFGSINFGYVQYAPQLGRNGAVAYCRCELIPLLWCWSRGLLATQLLNALVDSLGFRG